MLHSILLFIAIPKASARISQSYTLNQSPDGYDQLAANLAAGIGYRFYPDTALTLLREPGYPTLLAGIFIAVGKSFTVVKLTNMLLAFAVAYLMMRIARNLSNNRLLILGAPLLFLFHPETLIAESRGGVEILFGLMLTGFALGIFKAGETNRWSDYLVSGALLGLTALVRSTPILFPLVWLGYLLFNARRRAQAFVAVRNVTLMVIAMLTVLSPWIIRNYLLTSRFIPTASVLGVAADTGLYLATHQSIGNVLLDTEAAVERGKLARELGYRFKAGYYQYFYSSADEVAFSRYLLRSVLDKYARSPLLFVRAVVYNSFSFWCGGKTWKSVLIDAIVQLPLIGLSVMAIVLYVKSGRTKAIAPLALLIIYIVAVSVPVLAQARYSAPLMPFLSILALSRFSGDMEKASSPVPVSNE
jgi:hypothetical protein